MKRHPYGAANRLRRLPVLAVALGALAAGSSPAHAATLVVDRDRVQCASAGFTAIQDAVDAAQPGDLIRVCPDRYTESVVIDQPLMLKGDPEAIETVDCFQPTPSHLGDLDPTQQAIIDPAEDGFTVAFKLAANDVVLEGLVVEGASVGIDAADRFSGYRVDHNLIRLNTLFGIDFGSEGARESRVDHNCLRENQFGLMSELDDGSLWKFSDGPERDAWNARDLINVRIDHNATFRNYGANGWGGGLETAGPGRRDRVAFDHNASREELIAIALQNAAQSAIVENEVASTRVYSILLGGANTALDISSNSVRGTTTATGIRFAPEAFTLDFLPILSRDVLVTDNDVRGAAAGIYARPASLVASLIANNTTSENRGNGINMFSSGNVIRANQSNNNGVAGITAFPGAIGNRFEHNSMHGNASVPGASFPGADARDLNPLLNDMLQNDWIGNDCDTDIPAGMICGVG